MPITVKFIGALRHASGEDKCIVDCKKCTVKDLIRRITRKSPELLRNLVAGDAESLRPNALILVNGREISILDGLDTALKDGDEVVLVPVVHGG